jgi:hypothetical protein
MDRLEEQIRKNREELDRYHPSSVIWKRINRVLKQKKSGFYQWRSIAAIVAVVIGTAILFFITGTRWSQKSIDMQAREGMFPGSRQLKETEIYYNNLVNSLYLEATPLLTGNPEVEKELNTDISQLDSICADIKKDLKDNVANQEVVEALIQNYRIKIHLLEDMLTILKEDKNNPEKRKNYEL